MINQIASLLTNWTSQFDYYTYLDENELFRLQKYITLTAPQHPQQKAIKHIPNIININVKSFSSSSMSVISTA